MFPVIFLFTTTVVSFLAVTILSLTGNGGTIVEFCVGFMLGTTGFLCWLGYKTDGMVNKTTTFKSIKSLQDVVYQMKIYEHFLSVLKKPLNLLIVFGIVCMLVQYNNDLLISTLTLVIYSGMMGNIAKTSKEISHEIKQYDKSDDD